MSYLSEGQTGIQVFIEPRLLLTVRHAWGGLTISSGLLTAAPVGLATEAVETTLPGTVAWTAGLPYGDCDALL